MNMLHMINGILNNTLTRISDAAFKLRSLSKATSFSRKRKIGFADFLKALITLDRGEFRVGLEEFYRELSGDSEGTYSKQAFAKQRMNVRPEAIQELVDITTDTFYHQAQFDTFRGYILTAIDGSRYNLPNTPELEKLYGVQESSGAPQVQALGSCLRDVLNGLVLDCQFVSCKESERVLAEKHLDALRKIPWEKFIITLDRGYPSYDMIKAIEEDYGQNYVMRCPSEFVKGFATSEDDCVIKHAFSANRNDPLTFRMITLTLDSGEKEYLITNLFDKSFTMEDFRTLYHARWGIETLYNDMKNKLAVENFSGKRDVVIRQDFYATIYLVNLAAVMAFETREDVQAARKPGNRLQYKVNMNYLFSELRVHVVEMILSPDDAPLLLSRIANGIARAVIPLRPGRHVERKRKHPGMRHPQNLRR